MTELFFNLMHSNFVNKLTKIDNTFGAVLRKKRLFKKFTQEALSIESGLSRAYISELEMGHKDPSLYTIFKLASALKIKPSSIVDEVERQI
ncbi:helix-turn-helix domain-containing protein [Candidatus Methylopumilus rimovensis]|jgi:transcriptional regulator with XRE-family HTH domain|uniref:helix-turn-helix domain-containing protein n=1 Tax=Candidatus Methylopumilus rimovensis TaxID=2588535 RepID=UPI001CB9D1EC|nr:helix-turn-helix transcriptional regulator [Candidatus Methylopumilus rimovensis]